MKLRETVELLIPPSVVILLFLTIYELFFGFTKASYIIDIYDLYIIILFIIDLTYKYKEEKNTLIFIKKYWLDILATIPFNFIFYGIEGWSLTQTAKAGRPALIALKILRTGRIFRIMRVLTRLPRFIQLTKVERKIFSTVHPE